MKSNSTKLTITTHIEVFNSMDDLPSDDLELLKMAINALKSAYAPYSNFCVGAALLLENGKTHIGSNQENAAYPSGLCAERVAIFHASALYPNVPIKTIAVSVSSKNQIINEPVTPCGACRQAISEYEMMYSYPIRIIMSGETGKIYVSDSLENLLPLMFNKKHLK